MNQQPHVAIYEDRKSDKVIAFASTGYGMSDRWWKTTFRFQENNMLWAVYLVPSGKLRRTII